MHETFPVLKSLAIARIARLSLGVDNAVRTRDLLNHNQMLYLLSYIHHM